jgi:polar amino acid transport system substrate-binding protein
MACAGAISALATTLHLAAAEPVVVATEVPFPPYTDWDADGQIIGFDRDVTDEVCRRAKLDCQWETATFDALLPGVLSGRYDIAVGGITSSRARRAIVDFTIDYTVGTGADYFIGYAGAPDLPAASLGAQSGTIHAERLAAMDRAFRRYPTLEGLVEALRRREIDLAYGPFGDDLLSGLSAEGIEPLHEESIDEDGVAMAVCKGNTALLTALDTALGAMLEDGTIEEYSARWF